MAVLHVVNHAASLPACLAMAAAEDAVLLIEDGVYGAARGAVQAHPLYALEADVVARGLAGRLAGGVELVDDAGFVELVIRHCPVVTWR